ncbi:MAG: hypothetical protein IJH34_07375, partial [Romboutsia sp.]|nr:hypothetical protein [Romboutsia sp.]
EYAKMESSKKEAESKLLNRQKELEVEKNELIKEKNEAISSLEYEKKKFEQEQRELQNQMQKQLEAKELELNNERNVMQQKQEQLQNEMNQFIEKEKERLQIEKDEALSKELEIIRKLELEKSKELEDEKHKLMMEKNYIQEALSKQKIEEELLSKQKEEMEKEKQIIKSKQAEIDIIIKNQQEKLEAIQKEEQRIIEKEEELNKKVSNSSLNFSATNTKVITFLSTKSGVGTSSIAFNTAILLAKDKNVLYVELNDNFSSIGYTYKLSFYDVGIDIALKNIKNTEYGFVSNNIIMLDDIISSTSSDDVMLNNYKKMPKNLNFLFYSGNYYAEERENLDEYFKEFLMHILIKENYDYVIFDLNSRVLLENNKVILNPVDNMIMQFSSKIYFPLSQEITSIGNFIQLRKLIMKENISINSFSFILNKYEPKAKLTKSSIENWLNVDIKATIPNKYREFVDSSYVGLPIILACKDKDLQKSFKCIVDDITTNKNKK